MENNNVSDFADGSVEGEHSEPLQELPPSIISEVMERMVTTELVVEDSGGQVQQKPLGQEPQF